MMMMTITASKEITDICITPKDCSETEVTFMSSVDGWVGLPDDDPEDKRDSSPIIFSRIRSNRLTHTQLTKYHQRVMSL